MPEKLPRKQPESIMQQRCVAWFDRQYPALKTLLFATPNAQKRDKKQDKSGRWYTPSGNRQVREGLRAGTADLQLAIPRGGYHGLFIEMKIRPNKQSSEQINFQKEVENQGYKYLLCYSDEEFMYKVREYLRG